MQVEKLSNDNNQDPLFAVSGRLRDYWPGWTNWPGRSEGKTCRMKLDSLSLMRLLLCYITARVPRLLFLILSITHHFLPRVFAGPSAGGVRVLPGRRSCGTKEEIFFIFVIGETKMATVQPSAEFPASVGVYLSCNLSDSRRWGGGGGVFGGVKWNASF